MRNEEKQDEGPRRVMKLKACCSTTISLQLGEQVSNFGPTHFIWKESRFTLWSIIMRIDMAAQHTRIAGERKGVGQESFHSGRTS